ncbi:MAG: hypothetical protein EOO89_07355 [Pedobacter sp.]|nr:MAG: hypothetical protein EOO89_07355 [Pedobacter sp.]
MIRKVEQRAQQIVSGFKSPADDYLEGRLNISEMLVVDAHATFYFRMAGTSMSSYGIFKDAILIVDRSLKPVNEAVVIAPVGGELMCRCYIKNGSSATLISDRGTEELHGQPLEVWGVVLAVCHGLLPKGLKKGRYANVCAV